MEEKEKETEEKKICNFLKAVEDELGSIGGEIRELNESFVRMVEKLDKLETSFESIALSLEGILAHMPSKKNSSKD